MPNRLNQRRFVPLAGLGLAGCVLLSASFALHAAPPKKDAKKTPTSGKVTTAAAPTAQTNFSDNTPLTEDQKIVHVLNRMGYGPRPGDVQKVKTMGLAKYIDQQLKPETIDDKATDATLAPFADALNLSGDELMEGYATGLKNNIEIKYLQNALGEGKKNAPVPAADPTMTMDMTKPAAPPAGGTPTAKDNKRDAVKERIEAMSDDQKRALLAELQQDRRQAAQPITRAILGLSTAKVVRACDSEKQLQEVMVDFWTNHFNIDMGKNTCRVLKIADDRDVVRKYPLGKFRELLGASAHSPAMLVYLDNFQSVAPQAPRQNNQAANREKLKAALQAAAQRGNVRAQRQLARLEALPAPKTPAKPANKRATAGINENYAREIMELHTLGVDGGYTQKDVQEVARCLTGWGVSRGAGKGKGGGQFEFHPYLHDNGEKTVLGHTIPANGGEKDGEMVLDILASHPSTMRFVSRKLCQRFVSDTPPDSLIDKCVGTWKKTDGDIREIVRTIVTSPEFYSRAAYRQKIKSPFEYAVSSVRALGGSFDFSGQARRATVRGAGAGKKGVDALKEAAGRTVAGQVAVMGENLFHYPFPTGWSEDSRKWVSSGALISRLNYSLALVAGQMPQVDLTNSPLLDSASRTGDLAQTANHVADQVLMADVSPSTRATLLKEAGAKAATPPAQTANEQARLVALVLGSPEFQRR